MNEHHSKIDAFAPERTSDPLPDYPTPRGALVTRTDLFLQGLHVGVLYADGEGGLALWPGDEAAATTAAAVREHLRAAFQSGVRSAEEFEAVAAAYGAPAVVGPRPRS